MDFILGAAQIAPVLLDRERTLAKVAEYVRQAADAGCRLVTFGETLVPGYPFWLDLSDATRFIETQRQKEIHALYLDQAVQIEAGHLDELCTLAREHGITVVLGILERPGDRGGHSVFCSAVTIDAHGVVASVHRKLVPTYDERLSWANGDGHGLVTHAVEDFTVGTLICWENWMPLSRTALYAQGEDLHVALWPGRVRNTSEITRFIAREARSYVVSVSTLIRRSDIPNHLPGAELLREHSTEFVTDGGTCVAAPDGTWLVEPLPTEESLVVAHLDHAFVRRERQNFDPAGHYARPDVTRLLVDRRRQTLADFTD